MTKDYIDRLFDEKEAILVKLLGADPLTGQPIATDRDLIVLLIRELWEFHRHFAHFTRTS